MIGGTVDYLHLHFQEFASQSETEFFSTLGAGDVVTIYDSPGRWIEYLITSTSFNGTVWTFGIQYVEHDDTDGAGNFPTAGGNPVEMRFSRGRGADGVGLIENVAQGNTSGTTNLTHASDGGNITITGTASMVGFAGASGPSSSTFRIRRGTTVLAEITVSLQWTFESELSTWTWNSNTTPSVRLEDIEAPGAGNQSYNTQWTAGAAAPFAVGPTLRTEELT